MHFTSHRHVDGVDERDFILDQFTGILWTPTHASPTDRVPLILAGQPGGPRGINDTRDRLRMRAQRAAAAGLATATIEMPGSGARTAIAGLAEARAELRAAVTAGRPVPEEVTERLILPLAAQAVPEWCATMDALLALPYLNGKVGISGGVIAIATQLAASDQRVAAAVLFAGSFVPRTILETARNVTIPIHVLLQWDDEANDRSRSLELFDAFGSREKTLTANLGGHLGVPPHADDAANHFLRRHLR